MDDLNKKWRRFIGISAAVFGLFLIYTIGSKWMGEYKVDKLTDRMKTACVGRFLIDVPETIDFSYSHTFITGFWLSSFNENNEAFLARVAAREAEINAEPNEHGDKNMEKVQQVSRNEFSGKIFTFGRTTVEGVKDRKPIAYTNVALEGYVHSNGTTFTLKAEFIDPERTDILGQVIDKLRIVSPDEIPSASGFCFGPGMLIDPVPVDWTEGVAMFAGFRDHPDLAIAFNTRAGLKPSGPGRLERNARADEKMPLWQKPLLKKIRIGRRTINGIEGDEVLERGTELNFVNVYTFDWELNGTAHDVFVPAMHLEMSTGRSVNAGSPPVASFLGEEALVQLWDRISSSIRVRPTSAALSVNKEAPPLGAKLGDSASAKDICPESGWWRCAGGGNGISVLGGQRQFLRKGQRMPQALLLPPQKLWEKVKRIQPSYEDKAPTAWTLIDRRSKSRAEPDIELDPAITPDGRSSIYGTDISGAPAKIGSFVRTGTPCPASGWWRCQDSEALDGTRWFAQGELLPAATFRIEQSKFRVKVEKIEGFQRRSTWQLIRQATDPGETKAS